MELHCLQSADRFTLSHSPRDPMLQEWANPVLFRSTAAQSDYFENRPELFRLNSVAAL
jgi:hypothetical protein